MTLANLNDIVSTFSFKIQIKAIVMDANKWTLKEDVPLEGGFGAWWVPPERALPPPALL